MSDLWSVESSVSDEDVELRFEGLDADVQLVRAVLSGTRHEGQWRPGRVPQMKFSAEDRDDGTIGRLAACLSDLRSPVGVERVARALGTKLAVEYATDLLKAFETSPDGWARWNIGAAVDAMAGPALAPHQERIASLVVDPRFGRSREMLANALPRIKTDYATARTLDLLGRDREVDGHLLRGLRLAKTHVPEHRLRPLDADSRRWVRRELVRLRSIREGS